MKKPKIYPEKNYNLREIADNGFMGKGKTYFVCRNIINDELWKPVEQRTLNATKVGEGRGTSYFIKGENLIKYIEQNK